MRKVFDPGTVVLSVFSGISLVLYAIIFMIAPMNGEDYALTKNFDGYQVIERLPWIYQRSLEQINSWNARFGEQLAIFWLSMPKYYFTVFATLCFLIFSYLSSELVETKEKWSRKTLIALVVIFPLWPGYELFFWGTVNAGYMQPLTLSLFCVFFYSSIKRLMILVKNKYLYIILSIFAFFVGLSFENVPVALIMFMIGSVYISYKEILSFKVLIPIFSMAFGWLTLMLAPSTAHRRNFYSEVYEVKGYTVDYIISRIQDIYNVFFHSSEYLFFSALILVYFALKVSTEPRRMALLLLASILICGSLILVPYTEPRAFSFAWAIMLSICISGISYMLQEVPKKYKYFVLMVLFIYFPIKGVEVYSEFSVNINQRDSYIKSKLSTDSCYKGIAVSSYLKEYSYKYLNNRDKWYIENPNLIERYYGCVILIK